MSLVDEMAESLLPGPAYDYFASRLTYSGGQGSVLLMAGGLFIISFFLLLIVVRNALGGARPPSDLHARYPAVDTRPRLAPALEEGPPPLGRPLAAAERQKGRITGKRAAPGTLDEVLGRMAELGLGDPRIVASTPRSKRIRLYGCRGCRGLLGSDATAGDEPACSFEGGFLEGAFERLLREPVRAREVACRARGDASCDFEVTY